MARFRCYLCPPLDDRPNDFGREFEIADGVEPICPLCGSDEKSGGIHALVTIHYEAPLNERLRGKKGCGSLACDPGKKTSSGKFVVTGATNVVTCPDCLASDIWHSEATATKMFHPDQKAFFYRVKPAGPAAAVEPQTAEQAEPGNFESRSIS